MKFVQSIFKAYDIRGKVPAELTSEVANCVGRALADFLPVGIVAIGRDMRPDSEALAAAMIEGLIQQGREVVDLGQITSDMIYFAVGEYNYAGGAMITASHNPGEYNGIKLTSKGVRPIGQDSGLEEIKKALVDDDYKNPTGRGSVSSKNILAAWLNHALKFAPNLKRLKVGIDAGNGMGGIIVPELIKYTDLDIKGLYLDLDGTFPNHPANPLDFTNLKDLINLIKKDKLDCGIAFDGDGDRAFLVDENGDVVSGSVLGALLAEKILSENPGSTILYNAISSRMVAEVITENGGKAIRTKVGHSYIKADMRKHNAIFACEHSGHFYFKNNYYADSGLIAALYALEIISSSSKTLSELCKPLRQRYFDSGEINFEVADKDQIIEKLSKKYEDGRKDTLDGLTINFQDWWLNLRPSNTEPLLRLNIEAKTQDLLKSKLAEVSDLIQESISKASS